MNKFDLAALLAKESHLSRAKAADDVDTFVYHLLKDLKRSSAAVQEPRKTEKPASPSPAVLKEKR
jgi:nucleoid DNA-binding protein